MTLYMLHITYVIFKCKVTNIITTHLNTSYCNCHFFVSKIKSSIKFRVEEKYTSEVLLNYYVFYIN